MHKIHIKLFNLAISFCALCIIYSVHDVALLFGVFVPTISESLTLLLTVITVSISSLVAGAIEKFRVEREIINYNGGFKKSN